MFNRKGRFNRMHFNRASGGVIILRQRVHFASVLNAVVRSGASLYVSIMADAKMSADSRGAAKTYAELRGGAELQTTSRLTGALRETVEASSRLSARASAGAILSLHINVPAGLQASSFLGAQYFQSSAMESVLEAASRIGSILHETRASMATFLLAQVDSLSLDVDEMVINTMMPPGGVLVIDTYDYLVTLNNENAMKYHSGDWLFVDRELFDVQIMPISNGSTDDLRVNITYDERYL